MAASCPPGFLNPLYTYWSFGDGPNRHQPDVPPRICFHATAAWAAFRQWLDFSLAALVIAAGGSAAPVPGGRGQGPVGMTRGRRHSALAGGTGRPAPRGPGGSR